MLSKTKKKSKKKAAKKKISKKTAKVAKKATLPDKAHQPGHRKIKIAGIGESTAEKIRRQDSVVNNLTKADLARRRNSKNRRIITGAAIGKTGRITIKE